jgi:hypothetical protein
MEFAFWLGEMDKKLISKQYIIESVVIPAMKTNKRGKRGKNKMHVEVAGV